MQQLAAACAVGSFFFLFLFGSFTFCPSECVLFFPGVMYTP